jgi:hypothetical protein
MCDRSGFHVVAPLQSFEQSLSRPGGATAIKL